MVEFWNDPKIILIIMIVILIVTSLWSVYLIMRQLNAYYRAKVVPVEIRQYWSDDNFNTVRTLKIHSTILEIVSIILLTIIVGTLELYFGLLAIFWDVSRKMCFFSDREIWVSVFFMDLYAIYSYVESIPFILYAWKCIKRPAQQKKTALWVRIVVQLLLYIGVLVLVSVLTLAFVAVFLALDDLYFLAIILLLTVLLLFSLSAPIVMKTKRLEEGPLSRDIENLTNIVGFPIAKVKIRVTNSPDKSGNAFFYGCCCCKMIVIYDTLLLNKGLTDTTTLTPEEKGKGIPNDLVIAVIAHELGHWKYGHFYKTLIYVQIKLIILIGLLCLCLRHGPIYEAVGFEKGLTPIMPGILVISTLLLPYTTITEFILMLTVRCHETQADRFAHDLGYSKELCAGLMKLNADSASFPISDDWYSAWNETHPSMLKRCANLRRLKEKSNDV